MTLRTELEDLAPSGAQLHAASPHEQKQLCEAYATKIVDWIDHQGRQPSDWESDRLATAISNIFFGRYWVSVNAAVSAIADPATIAENPFLGSPPLRLTIQQFRSDLAYISGIPVRG